MNYARIIISWTHVHIHAILYSKLKVMKPCRDGKIRNMAKTFISTLLLSIVASSAYSSDPFNEWDADIMHGTYGSRSATMCTLNFIKTINDRNIAMNIRHIKLSENYRALFIRITRYAWENFDEDDVNVEIAFSSDAKYNFDMRYVPDERSVGRVVSNDTGLTSEIIGYFLNNNFFKAEIDFVNRDTEVYMIEMDVPEMVRRKFITCIELI